jgi:hypothetical protein
MEAAQARGHIPPSCRPAGQAIEIGKHRCNEPLPTRVLRERGSSKQIEEITRLDGGFLPIRGRSREQLRFQLIASKLKRSFVGFDLGQQPALTRGFLRGHPAVLVEINGSIGHVSQLRAAGPLAARVADRANG